MKKLLAALCGAALLAGCVNTSKSNQPLRLIQDAPEFTLKNVLGGEVKSSDLKGKVLVVDFWATWCVPCKIEIPKYNELRAKYKDRGVEFIGVTFESSVSDTVKTMTDLKVEYPVTMATDQVDKDFGGHYGYPTLFLVGKDWKIYRKKVGGYSKDLLDKDIDALLKKESSD
jgi:thiol-disulfide isomerase/thioredoxin